MADQKTNDQRMRCWGVAFVCRMQYAAYPKSHECKHAGKCIFAPKAAAHEKTVSGETDYMQGNGNG